MKNEDSVIKKKLYRTAKLVGHYECDLEGEYVSLLDYDEYSGFYICYSHKYPMCKFYIHEKWLTNFCL